jgi:hypothetical protein
MIIEYMNHSSESIRLKAIRCLESLIETGACSSDLGMIVAVIRARFQPDTREACEELRTLLFETLTAVLVSIVSEQVVRAPQFYVDVLYCIQQGLLDDYSPVQIAATKCLEVLIKTDHSLPDSVITPIFDALQSCCKSSLWRVRQATLKCMHECHQYYSDQIWYVLNPVIERLICDQSLHVRLAIVPLCFRYDNNPSIESLYYAIILCFDDSPEIVSSALSLLHIDPHSSVLSDPLARSHAIADAFRSTAYPQSILDTVLIKFATPSLSSTSRLLSLRLVPILVLLLHDDPLATRDLIMIMLQYPNEPFIQLACRCAPIAAILSVLKNLLSGGPNPIQEVLILVQTIVSSQNVDDDSSLLLVDSLETVLLSDQLDTGVAQSILSLSQHLANSPCRDRLDSVLIRLLAYCPNHPAYLSIRQESFSRELDSLIQTALPLSAANRKVVIQLNPRIDGIKSEIYPQITECLKTSDLITRIDGLEMLYLVCQKNLDPTQLPEIIDGIESNLKWSPGQANNKVRKIALFVLYELMVKRECLLTPDLVALLTNCVNDSWSPDNRYLSLNILALGLDRGEICTGVQKKITEHLIERLEDMYEEIRSLAFTVIDKMGLSGLDSETRLRISEILKLHARQVSNTAQRVI